MISAPRRSLLRRNLGADDTHSNGESLALMRAWLWLNPLWALHPWIYTSMCCIINSSPCPREVKWKAGEVPHWARDKRVESEEFLRITSRTSEPSRRQAGSPQGAMEHDPRVFLRWPGSTSSPGVRSYLCHVAFTPFTSTPEFLVRVFFRLILCVTFRKLIKPHISISLIALKSS